MGLDYSFGSPHIDIVSALGQIANDGEVKNLGRKIDYVLPDNAKERFCAIIKDRSAEDVSLALVEFLQGPLVDPQMQATGSYSGDNIDVVRYELKLRNSANMLGTTMFMGKRQVPGAMLDNLFSIFSGELGEKIKALDVISASPPDFSRILVPSLNEDERPVFIMRKPDSVVSESNAHGFDMNFVHLPQKLSSQYAYEVRKALIERLGGIVINDPMTDVFGSQFTRDCLLLPPNGAMLASDLAVSNLLGHKEYDKLQPATISLLKEIGFNKVVVFHVPIEGGDVVFAPKIGKMFCVTVFPEQMEEIAGDLKRESGLSPQCLSIKKSHWKQFYHLDLALSVLPNGEILYYKDCFDNPEDIESLGKEFGVDVIEADSETAEAFGINLIPIGDTLLMPNASDKVRETLAIKGYQVVSSNDLKIGNQRFNAMNAGIRCTTLELPAEYLKSRGINPADLQTRFNGFTAREAERKSTPLSNEGRT